MVLVTTAGEVGTEAALLLSRQDVPVRVLTRHPERATRWPRRQLPVLSGDRHEFDSPLRG